MYVYDEIGFFFSISPGTLQPVDRRFYTERTRNQREENIKQQNEKYFAIITLYKFLFLESLFYLTTLEL